jgi:hypothetical protein
VGRRIITHEFPFKEIPYTEDLGRGVREYTLEAHVIGDGHENIRDQLIQAIETNKEPGILIHPIFGAVRVSPGPIEHVFDNTEGNIEYFNLTFLEAGENKYPSPIINTGSQVESAGSLLMYVLKSSFDDSFTLKRLPGFVVTTAQTTNTHLITQLQQAAEVAPADSTAKGAFTAAVSQLSTGTLLSIASQYSLSIQSIITSLEGLFTNPSDGFLAYQKLSTFGDDFLPIPETSPNRKIEKQNRDLQVALVKRQALIGMAITASKMTFPSYDDAVATRDLLARKLDTEQDIVGTTDDDQTFGALADLKAAMVLDITERAANLARIKNIFPSEPLPALVMAYEIYGSIDQAEEIRTRNKVRNPNFMPAGKSVQVLELIR